jgi:hypothetical protein
VKGFVSGVAAGAPATRHAISQLDTNTYENFFEMVEELLSDYSSTNGVALPTQANICFGPTSSLRSGKKTIYLIDIVVCVR